MNLRMASLAWLALAGSACQNPPARFSSTSNSSASASAPHGGFSASMAGAWPRVGGAAAATSDATAGRPGSASAAPRATAEPASSRYRTVEPLALVEPFGAASDPDALARLCDSGLEAARLRLAAVLERAEAPSGELGWEVTFGRLDEARLALANATELASLLGVVHPSAAMRSAAGECELRAEAVETELFVEPRVLAVLERAAAALRAPGAPPLTAERGRFIDETLRELVRNGARLDAAGRERLTWINERVTETGQGFIAALSGPQGGLKVRASQLKGMSETFRRAHPPDSDRKVILSTEPSEVAEFLTFAEDRTAARALHVKLLNRGGEANVARLDRLLALRREKAQLLGHASWADFVTAGRMAGSASAVRAFLERVERAIAPAVEREFAELMREHMRQPGYRPRLALTEADRLYLIERLRARTYKIDSAKVAEYFEIESVTRGLFELSTELFGVAFQEVVAPVWHPSVRAFDVSRAGVSLGRIYLDRFARPDKYRNPAMFGVRGRRRFSDGREQLPVAALVARLSEPNKPMPHEQVAIYFHEFGHVLQHLLSENELASYAGTNVPRDAVEAVSQVVEAWAFAKSVLERLARHRETKRPPPPALLDALLRSRRVGQALALQRQLSLAWLDLELHTAPVPTDATLLVERVQRQHDPFAPVPGTHLQSSFSHLVGYDAAYYGYPWSYALARDALTRFETEGFVSARVAQDFHREVLARAGARDPRESWRAFLGREPSERALVEFFLRR